MKPLAEVILNFDMLKGRGAAFWRAVGQVDCLQSPVLRQRHRESFYTASKVASVTQEEMKKPAFFFPWALFKGYQAAFDEMSQPDHPVFNADSVKNWASENPLDKTCNRLPTAGHVLEVYWRFGPAVPLVRMIHETDSYIMGVAGDMAYAILQGRLGDRELKAISHKRQDIGGLVLP